MTELIAGFNQISESEWRELLNSLSESIGVDLENTLYATRSLKLKWFFKPHHLLLPYWMHWRYKKQCKFMDTIYDQIINHPKTKGCFSWHGMSIFGHDGESEITLVLNSELSKVDLVELFNTIKACINDNSTNQITHS